MGQQSQKASKDRRITGERASDTSPKHLKSKAVVREKEKLSNRSPFDLDGCICPCWVPPRQNATILVHSQVSFLPFLPSPDFTGRLCDCPGYMLHKRNRLNWPVGLSELSCPAEEKRRERFWVNRGTTTLARFCCGDRGETRRNGLQADTQRNALQAETLRTGMLDMGRFPSNVCSSSLLTPVHLADSPALARGPLITSAAQAIDQGSCFGGEITR